MLDPGKSLGLRTEHYCFCPASRLKKVPRVSDRDLSGLMDGGSYRSEARAWSDTPLCVVHSGQDVAAAFAMGAAEGREVVNIIEGIGISLAHQLPGKPAQGHAFLTIIAETALI